ncbi:glycosyltransferase family 39 protein [Tsukamurella soli]|uniref:glycosyltransferase family 39 protein n=1 Tax=Tsukamurella soli TaxID=644556 RepID=UPI0036189F1D
MAACLSPFVLLQSQLLATNAVDAPFWSAITLLLVRWVRTRRDRLLLTAGVLTAIDMQVKWLIPGFWVALAIAVAAAGPRELLRRPALWLGGLVTVVTTLPAVLWQNSQGWPYFHLTEQVAAEGALTGGRLLYLPLLLLYAGPLGAVLTCCALWWLLRAPDWRPYRFLAVTFLLLAAAVWLVAGRPYYAGGLYIVLIAVGSVELARRWQGERSDGGSTEQGERSDGGAGVPVVLRALLAVGAVLGVATIVVFLPLARQSHITPPKDLASATLRTTPYGQFGWPELTRDVEQAVAALPPDRKPDAIITEMYWQAGSLDYYGDSGLPVYSYSRGYGWLGTPPDSARRVVWVGVDDDAAKYCARSTLLRHIGTDRIGFPTASTDVDIRYCEMSTPWSRIWGQMRRM